jgi:hypothetical protein
MAGMAPGEGGVNAYGPRSRARKRAPTQARAALAVPALACAVLAVAGCSGDRSEDPDPPQPTRPVALQVKTVFGARGLDASTRTELETEVGDVLSRYVVRAFLGDYPRENFVSSFDSFTGGAARHAVEDLDLLTAARFADAAAVDATRLNARLSFLVDDEDVVGATAGVRFAFAVSQGEAEPRQFTLRGRFVLVEEAGAWSIFEYDVARDDGAAARTGESS